MERCDFVNDDLRLIQDTEGLTFGTDALLLAGYINGKYKHGCELGSGSGIISMLLLTRNKVQRVTALEVQEHYADLTRRNAELNELSDRMECVCSDLRDYKATCEFDLIYTNPPYMKPSERSSPISNRVRSVPTSGSISAASAMASAAERQVDIFSKSAAINIFWASSLPISPRRYPERYRTKCSALFPSSNCLPFGM